MNIVHISSYDIQNGAAKAAFRLHQAMLKVGHQSKMIVHHKESQDQNTYEVEKMGIWGRRLKRISDHYTHFMRDIPATSHWFDMDEKPDIGVDSLFRNIGNDAEIICLYLLKNMLSTKQVSQLFEKTKRPLVWILMDMAPLTGGCHHPLSCHGYKEQCGHCPQLKKPREKDRSRIIWMRKKKYLGKIPITFVAPTNWLVNRIEKSSIYDNFNVEVIPLALDINIFRPFQKKAAKDLLGIPRNKKIILFGSSYLHDERKGMIYLYNAFLKLKELIDSQRGKDISSNDILLLVTGRDYKGSLKSLPFPYRHLGFVNEDLIMALAYQASDIFVCPSIYDAGPMMIPEAMLCGTPVVAFDTGGAPDLIKTMETGYLAKFKDAEDLAMGIKRVLSSERLPMLREEARKVAVKKHDMSIVAQKYTELFRKLIDASR